MNSKLFDACRVAFFYELQLHPTPNDFKIWLRPFENICSSFSYK